MYNSSHLAGRVPSAAAAFKKSPFAGNCWRIARVVLSSLPLLRKKKKTASKMLKNNYGEHTSDTSLIFRVVNHFSPKITMYNQCPSHYFSFRIVYLSTEIMKKKSDG